MGEVPAQESQQTFGQWLQAKIHESRMSIQELAQKARISRGSIYHYLKDGRVPDETSLNSLSAALMVDLSDMPATEPRKVGRPRSAPIQGAA